MTIRFFILRAHYRSTVDFSNDALLAAEKGLEKLMNALQLIEKMEASSSTTIEIANIKKACYDAMNDDLNSPIVISNLFEGVRIINTIASGQAKISASDLEELKTTMKTFAFDILGLCMIKEDSSDNSAYHNAIDLLLQLRMEMKEKKDFATADLIRNKLTELGFEIKDKKDGFDWKLTSK
jgi:cysteinyl-tRNA synthetase